MQEHINHVMATERESTKAFIHQNISAMKSSPAARGTSRSRHNPSGPLAKQATMKANAAGSSYAPPQRPGMPASSNIQGNAGRDELNNYLNNGAPARQESLHRVIPVSPLSDPARGSPQAHGVYSESE